MKEIIARKYQMFGRTLNEYQRRMWAATEAVCLGHGGVSISGLAHHISKEYTFPKSPKSLQSYLLLVRGKLN